MPPDHCFGAAPLTVFFTADTHFGDHRTINIQKRPFANVMEMDAALIERWNAVVGPDDVVEPVGRRCVVIFIRPEVEVAPDAMRRLLDFNKRAKDEQRREELTLVVVKSLSTWFMKWISTTESYWAATSAS